MENSNRGADCSYNGAHVAVKGGPEKMEVSRGYAHLFKGM